MWKAKSIDADALSCDANGPWHGQLGSKDASTSFFSLIPQPIRHLRPGFGHPNEAVSRPRSLAVARGLGAVGYVQVPIYVQRA
jgi:hypothetical protein